MNQSEMTAKMEQGDGFIAALDQSGGSTPKALSGYGVQEGAAGGGNEGELIRDAGMVERRYGVPAAGHRDQAAFLRQCGRGPRQRDGGGIERRRLEGAERAVPDQGPACLESIR